MDGRLFFLENAHFPFLSAVITFERFSFFSFVFFWLPLFLLLSARGSQVSNCILKPRWLHLEFITQPSLNSIKRVTNIKKEAKEEMTLAGKLYPPIGRGY